MKTIESLVLPPSSPGTQRSIPVLRYASATPGRKAYIQAGLHAEEAPGFIVAHHLEHLLDQAEILEEIILVPMANPIGLDQWYADLLRGRFDTFDSINFNRDHIDLAPALAEIVAPLLSQDIKENVRTIRENMHQALERFQPMNESQHLKKMLFSLACDADVVLDLHCDNEALLHLYLGTPLWPEAADLAAQLGVNVTLLAKNSGGNPFDEACSRVWWELAQRFPSFPIPCACLAATVELRGIGDTDPGMCQHDARNIFTFLQRRGFVNGNAPRLPQLINEATPLTGVDYIRATVPGIISFTKKIGDRVEKEETIAHIFSPLPEPSDAPPHKVKSVTRGIFFARIHDRFARPGRVIAKVAGQTPLHAENGQLLTMK